MNLHRDTGAPRFLSFPIIGGRNIHYKQHLVYVKICSPVKTNMADRAANGEDQEDNLQHHEELSSQKSPSIFRIAFDDFDEIAKKLLDSKLYLTALELHTELIEYRKKELPRLKEFFSNPNNFEIQARLDPLSIISK